MGWLEWIRGRDESFFTHFERHAALDVEGAAEFVSLVASGANTDFRTKRIKELEHEADVVTHECIAALHKTLLTPLSRDVIHRLITRMDDVLDFVEAAAERIGLYELREMTPDVRELARLVLRCTQLMQEAVLGLRHLENPSGILAKGIEVHELENQADTLLRAATARLLKESDPLLVIKWKEIYELLETATDRCEDVANTIEGIVLEHG